MRGARRRRGSGSGRSVSWIAELDRLNQRPEGQGWDPTSAAGEPSYRIVRIVVDEWCKVSAWAGGPCMSRPTFYFPAF